LLKASNRKNSEKIVSFYNEHFKQSLSIIRGFVVGCLFFYLRIIRTTDDEFVNPIPPTLKKKAVCCWGTIIFFNYGFREKNFFRKYLIKKERWSNHLGIRQKFFQLSLGAHRFPGSLVHQAPGRHLPAHQIHRLQSLGPNRFHRSDDHRRFSFGLPHQPRYGTEGQPELR